MKKAGGFSAGLLFCRKNKLAPEVGLEPTTNRLTAGRSTTELLGSAMRVRPPVAAPGAIWLPSLDSNQG